MRITVPETVQRFGAALRLLASAASTALFAAVLVPLLLSLVASLPGCVPQKGTIGAVIAQDDQSGRLFLRELPPELAAARAHLKVGDEILLIDGLDVRFMDAKQINAALLGEVDSTVKLTLIRDEQVLRVTLKRTEAQKLLKPRKKSAETAS
jgi:C-terminal processing protease CtpA/Prc